MLVLLYYLSQNPDFAESVKPLMDKLKNSQQMLDFLNDLSKFTQTFSTLKPDAKQNQSNTSAQDTSQKKNPQSPTAGIADAFIEDILNGYLKKQ